MFKVRKNDNGRELYVLGKKLLSIGTHSNGRICREIDVLQTMSNVYLRPDMLPQAKGYLRDIQLADVKILKEIDRICKTKRLTYWIDFGTLLGAIRHKGFIPWDDDIDISMTRDDYEVFVDIFNEECKYSELQAVLCSHKDGIANTIKVIHKKSPSIFIDIFPVDIGYKDMNVTDRLAFSCRIKDLSLKHAKNKAKYRTIEEFHKSFLDVRDKNLKDVLKHKENDIPTVVFYGIEFWHYTHTYNAFDYNDIFPLKDIIFEDCVLPCVNDVRSYLTYIFGNFEVLPKKLHIHTDLSRISLEEIFEIRKFIAT